LLVRSDTAIHGEKEGKKSMSHSRLKFNPISREIEVEGSESFVKLYFNKLQAILADEGAQPKERKASGKAVVSKKKEAPKAKAKKTAAGKTVAGKAPKKAGKKVATALEKIVSALKGSANGLTTSQLREKTGLKQRQIWTTIYRAQKMGKIAKAKRGSYVVL